MNLKWVKQEFLLVLIEKHCYSHWEFIRYLPLVAVYPAAACCNSNCTWYKLNSIAVSGVGKCYYNHFHLLLEIIIYTSISCRWMKLKYAVYQGGLIPHHFYPIITAVANWKQLMFSVYFGIYGYSYSAAASFFFFFFSFAGITSYSFINKSQKWRSVSHLVQDKRSSSLNPMHWGRRQTILDRRWSVPNTEEPFSCFFFPQVFCFTPLPSYSFSVFPIFPVTPLRWSQRTI